MRVIFLQCSNRTQGTNIFLVSENFVVEISWHHLLVYGNRIHDKLLHKTCTFFAKHMQWNAILYFIY